MKKEERLQVYQMYDGHCAYCGKPIKYEDMQVDHFIAKTEVATVDGTAKKVNISSNMVRIV